MLITCDRYWAGQWQFKAEWKAFLKTTCRQVWEYRLPESLRECGLCPVTVSIPHRFTECSWEKLGGVKYQKKVHSGAGLEKGIGPCCGVITTCSAPHTCSSFLHGAKSLNSWREAANTVVCRHKDRLTLARGRIKVTRNLPGGRGRKLS